MRCIIGAVIAFGLPVGMANASEVYFNDFSTTGLDGLGGIESVQGYEGVNGISGSFFRNDALSGASTLMLSGLGNHDFLEIEFALALIDSWDGGLPLICCGDAVIGPDFFNLSVDGSEVFETSNFDGLSSDAMNEQGGTFGFNPQFDDSAYTVSISVPHSAGTASLSFFADGAGYQGSDDESWAIDNLRISARGGTGPEVVPLPATLPLMLGALALIGLRARRKT